MSASPVSFVKMHGLGNDVLILESPDVSLTPSCVRQMADRHRGVGCDQVLRLSPSKTADANITIWNRDGSEAQACGNGMRCVVGLMAQRRNFQQTSFRLETLGGLVEGSFLRPGEAEVFQGTPSFLAPSLDLSDYQLGVGFPVGIGNPHLVIPVPVLDVPMIQTLGPCLEAHPFFPEWTNVAFVQRTPESLRVKIWERGAGLTQACGSGACAVAFVASHNRWLPGRENIPVDLDGGRLWVTVLPDGRALQRGPFQWICQGIFGGSALVSP